MFRLTSAALLVAASFVAAEIKFGPTTITSDEYVKEYLKLVGESHDHVNKELVGEVEPEKIKIRLYSSPEDVFEETLKTSFNLLNYPQFNKSLETKIYLHGWLEKEDHKLQKVLPALYALRGKQVNWITVDWSEYSYYTISSVRKQVVPKLAEHLVPLIEKLMEMQNNNKVHLIGFGVGAHVAGFAGKHIHGKKFARITGLSPAGQFYNDVDQNQRLAKGDAEYVDIIHTNMGYNGISRPVGDVDFLPNGGRQQPAAENRADYTEVQKHIVSHMLAKIYYVESVELGYGGFIGKKCDSWSNFLNQECATHETEIMGEAASKKVSGTVYLTVNKQMKPFYSQGIYGIYPYPSSTYDHSYSGVPKRHV